MYIKMNASKNTYAIKILLFLLIVGVIAGVIAAVTTNSDSETKTTPSPGPDIEAKWVAVGDDSARGNIMHSENGKVWTETETGDYFGGDNALGNGVAYGTSNGISQLWVAVGKGNVPGGYGNIMYSENGKVWKNTSTGEAFDFEGFGVAYGTSDGISQLWVAVGDGDGDDNNYGNIMYSENGKVWTKTSTGEAFDYEGFGVAYGTSDGISQLWVAVGDGDGDDNNYGNIMYSENGKVWTKTTSGDSFSEEGFGVAYGTSDGISQLWVAVGHDSGRGNIMHSENGKVWTETETGDYFGGVDGLGNGVAYGTSNGISQLWVAVGKGNVPGGYGNIMYSENGKVWKNTSTGEAFVSEGFGVAYRTDGISPLWVAVGDSAGDGYGSIMYSNNGKVWSRTTSGQSFSVKGKGVAFDQVLYGVCTTNYHPQ